MAHLLNALRYKSEGLGVRFRLVSLVLGSTQALTEINVRNIFWE